MAKHRTKAQKRKAAEQHFLQAHPEDAAMVEQLPAGLKTQLPSSSSTSVQWSGSASQQPAKNSASPEPTKTFFGFDPKWVYQDLRKTALVSCLIVGLLVAAYFLSLGRV